jgi:hypothetical protein
MEEKRKIIHDLVVKVLSDGLSERQRDKILRNLQNVAPPEIVDWIFHSEKEMTVEEIVDAAMAYKPILLGPPEDFIES